MSSLEDLIAQLPIGDIAKQLGVDSGTAEAAVKQALPALVGGLEANAKEGGADSIAKAVEQHGTALVDGGVSLADVDTADGEKIVDHVFGDKKQDVVAALGNTQPAAASSPISGDLIGKLLPMLAPVVMSFLAKQFQGKQEPAASDAAGQPAAGGGGIGDVLGGLLGGLTGGGTSSGSGGSAGGGLGDILGSLGGLFGGGTKK
ncbi:MULTISPECIES: DUF937 domain-containing protein [unclassified Plantibacter]|uniref:DUF937 domain-containing protein n=1 Tax=unclassified Plantibacter TaxID=2624265 RepID=UPI003D32FA2E